MPQLTLELPDDLTTFLFDSGGGPDRAALEAISLEAYRQHKISTGRLAEVLGYRTTLQAHAFLKEHGIHLNYDLEELEHDRGSGDQIPFHPRV